MKGLRGFLTIATALCLAALAACERLEGPGLSADLERELAQAREHAGALVVRGRSATEVDDETAIALGYLERLRLGLGSPFRLVDYALKDSRLDEGARTMLAWALLARTLDGESYEVDPVVLDRAGLAGVGPIAGAGRYHLELIEAAITESHAPTGAELAIRLAYALAAAEGSVTQRGASLAAQAAALIRDRRIARADALALLREAETQAVDPLVLIPVWRAERRFRVEAPAMAPLPLHVEREATELAPRMARAIRSLGPRLGSGTRPTAPVPPLLSRLAALRLAGIAQTFDPPPQTSVVVAVSVHRRELLEERGLTTADRASRIRFIDRTRTEEGLAAEYALLLSSSDARPASLPLTTLWAGIALRSFGQEEVWFPGFGGPSARELEDRFGLASVRFDDDVPASWRPYYRSMLERSLADMQRVLPALDLRGLRIHFGETVRRERTLALHDPRTRTIYLPPATGAGTIAHEIAHDLDWQVALRRYRVRGDYATDRAVRLQNDRLAAAVQSLSPGILTPPVPGGTEPPMHARRPAEVFARAIDWYVVVSLARDGRVNGYLSSVQDDLLTGYGTVGPPDMSGRAGAALIEVLDEVAPLYAADRRWFLEHHGPGRAVTPYDLVRQVIEAPTHEADTHAIINAAAFDSDLDGDIAHGRDSDIEHGRDSDIEHGRDPADVTDDLDAPARPSLGGAFHFSSVQNARDDAFGAIGAWVCRAPGASYDQSLESARRRLVGLAAGARARGIALEYASAAAGEPGRRWVAHRFYGYPWPANEIEPVLAALLSELVAQARSLATAEIPATTSSAFHSVSPPDHCAAEPLLGLSSF